MNRLFHPPDFITVPDGTRLTQIIDTSRLVKGGGTSIAKGVLPPGTRSAIHMLPVVDQIAYLVAGELVTVMQETPASPRYEIELRAGEASFCASGTALQLVNRSSAVAEVLYIVTPSFAYVMKSGALIYDDAMVLAKDWDEVGFGEAFAKAASKEARADAAERRQAALETAPG